MYTKKKKGYVENEQGIKFLDSIPDNLSEKDLEFKCGDSRGLKMIIIFLAAGFMTLLVLAMLEGEMKITGVLAIVIIILVAVYSTFRTYDISNSSIKIKGLLTKKEVQWSKIHKLEISQNYTKYVLIHDCGKVVIKTCNWGLSSMYANVLLVGAVKLKRIEIGVIKK